MASAQELQDSLESFAESCNGNERLKEMIRDWNRTIYVHATDLGSDHTLVTDHGDVQVRPGIPATPDLAIRSTGETLSQIFFGELSPNDPYNDGTLQVQGPEADILRLDFIIAMLWE